MRRVRARVQRLIDHVDLRVHDLAQADAFYSELLPALGYPRRTRDKDWICFDAESGEPTPFIALLEDRQHRPNATRLAFWKDARADVEALGPLLQRIGAKNIEGPELCPEYSPHYYAVFFEDPSGNRLEVCCRSRQTVDRDLSTEAQSLWQLERRLWLEGPEVYRQHLDENTLMVFAGVGILQGPAIIKSLEQVPRWAEVSFENAKLVSPGDGVVVLAYTATARRADGPSYQALCSTTYRTNGDRVRLVQHQQTPLELP